MSTAESQPLAPLIEAVKAAQSWFLAEPVSYLLIGGIAASILGRPRMTRDVDAVVWLDEVHWIKFAANGGSFGFEPRLTDAVEFARRSRVLLMRHVRSAIDVDISFGSLPFERQAIDRGIMRTVLGAEVRVPMPEDLLVMKALAHRPRDISDIEGLVASNANLDWEQIREHLTEFAHLLDQPDLATSLDRFAPRRAAKPGKPRKRKGK